jgi:hypothetical protein
MGAVVDPSINVYDVEALKIADLRVTPRNVGTHTEMVVS